ncbi:MAG: DUF1285 domain-containing protein [Syntrophomonadaceae bacterium]
MDLKEIVIRKDGKWYFGGAEMFRRNILNILARNIKKQEDGSYAIELEQDTSPITVEDVPFLAQGIYEENGYYKLVFHDLQELVLDHELKITLKGDVPYIDYKWPADTRLSKGLYWKLSDWFEFRGEDIYIVPPGIEHKK